MLFSHPADFTPVCTTEFVAFAELAEEFTARNVALLGNSIDSVYSHLAWTQAINDKLGVRTLSGCLTEQTARAVAAGPGRIAGLATPVMAVTGTVVEDSLEPEQPKGTQRDSSSRPANQLASAANPA